jgi:hypothetical protein
MTHGLFGSKERLRIVPTWSGDNITAAAVEFPSRAAALELLRPCAVREEDMSRLRALLAHDRLYTDAWELEDEQVLNEIAWRLATRRFQAVREKVERRPLPPKSEPGAPPAASTAPPPRKQKTWVEFLFQYPDRTPVSGLDYILEDTEGVQESGTLGANGLISRKDIPEGTYTVILKDIVQLAWDPAKVLCDDKVKIVATTAGFPYGTAAKIRIFREFREEDKDVIQTLQAKVQNDRIEAEWKYDYTTPEARKAETGVARFIAEVQLEGGKYWMKTPAALEMELKSIERLAWAQPKVEEGQATNVEVETLGFADGTQVKIELWHFGLGGDNKKVTEFPAAQISGGKAKLRCGFGKGASGDTVISDPGEYFLVANIEGKAPRTARSGLVWCVHPDLKDTAAVPDAPEPAAA